ncbi:MAG: hypothetical protein ABSC46_13985 [Candidatus Limnocylindrales bacterium]|jgi:hypothetical protein
MGSDRARPAAAADAGETRRRLTSEVAEVEGAMELVASGAASRITLSGLRFGEQLAQRFRHEAHSRGLRLEPILWPEDTGCDLIVRRIDE